MSKLYNGYDEECEEDNAGAMSDECSAYPKKLRVDGYDVNHYYTGDLPVYEIRDSNGDILNVAHSTAEMHEFTRGTDNSDHG